MKDSKFIELLNLYVDHQINAADAALLEAEIQHKPERRQIYRQYCQMQKACVMLADNFRTEAPVGGKIADFGPPVRHRFAPFAYGMGAIAAAACVALVMVNRSATPARNLAQVSPPPTEVAVQVQPSVAPTTLAALPTRVPLQPAFSGTVRDGTTPGLALISADSVALQWLNEVKLQRVPVEELSFEPRPTSEPADLMFRSRRTFQGQAEMAAIRFQK